MVVRIRNRQQQLEHRVEARTAELKRAGGELKAEIAERRRAEDALQAGRNLVSVILNSARTKREAAWAWQSSGERSMS